jgi:hypothetical protein
MQGIAQSRLHMVKTYYTAQPRPAPSGNPRRRTPISYETETPVASAERTAPPYGASHAQSYVPDAYHDKPGNMNKYYAFILRTAKL